jgi:hypothetical protein
MAWIIASIPFWAFGAWSLIAAVNRPDSLTDRQNAIATMGCLLSAGILFLIAAKICS